MRQRRHVIALIALRLMCTAFARAQQGERSVASAGPMTLSERMLDWPLPSVGELARPNSEPAVPSSPEPLRNFESSSTADLPDAPGFYPGDGDSMLLDPFAAGVLTAPPPALCPMDAARERYMSPEAAAAMEIQAPCVRQNPYKLFLDSPMPIPLTAHQKARLALHNLVDPFNLLTIVGNSAYTIAADSHTAYGPGWDGFGRNVGYSLAQDATGDFIAVYAISSITHQDPHYHRMPMASIPRRVLHATATAVIAQSDSGRTMPNYMLLLGAPICIELSNLYVPGVNGNLPSSVERYVTGVATEPIGNLITEFLPDVASHVHIRVLFVQRILNQVAAGTNGTTTMQ